MKSTGKNEIDIEMGGKCRCDEDASVSEGWRCWCYRCHTRRAMERMAYAGSGVEGDRQEEDNGDDDEDIVGPSREPSHVSSK